MGQEESPEVGVSAQSGGGSHAAPKRYPEDTDDRDLWDPTTRYEQKFVDAQRREGAYILAILAACLLGLIAVGVGLVDRLLCLVGMNVSDVPVARSYEWLCLGGLLGGTVYSAKWLYHAIAKGMWHEDRRTWRYLSPWISLGTTVGVGALFIAGFLKTSVDSTPTGATYTGVGFLIGYFSDMFLAKMKELTQVLFGESESHFKRARGSEHPPK